jgi:DNA repair protein RadC
VSEEKPDYLGHRRRLRERFLDGEGTGMSDYELVELLLCQAQPRGDMKPLAKALGVLRHLSGAQQGRVELAHHSGGGHH